MGEPYDYTGSRAVIYDEEKHATIAKATVLDYQSATHTITVARSAFQQNNIPEHLSLLLIHDAAVYEYKGTVRKLGKTSEKLEIALYKGQEKEERAVMRYNVNTPGRVESLVMVGKQVPLSAPVDVIVCNISTQGCLVQGSVSCLNVGATFQLKVLTEDTPILLYPTVVRVIPQKGGVAQFGCSFGKPETKDSFSSGFD